MRERTDRLAACQSTRILPNTGAFAIERGPWLLCARVATCAGSLPQPRSSAASSWSRATRRLSTTQASKKIATASGGSIGQLRCVRLVSLLAPHLLRAMQAQLGFGPLSLIRDGALDLVDQWRHGCVLVTLAGQMLYANRAANGIDAARG